MIGMAERVLAIVAGVGWLTALALGGALWVQSATAWERAAKKLRDDVTACNREREADRQRDDAAVAAARAAQVEADRTLKAWMDRYAAAECAAVERMRICEVTP
jgi:hypothetical protein